MVSFVVNGAPPAWVLLPHRGVGIPDAEPHIVTPVLKMGEGASVPAGCPKYQHEHPGKGNAGT